MQTPSVTITPMDHPVRHPATSSKPIPADTVWTATGHERPVFLDEHGRRRRWVLFGGALSGSASVLWLGALVAGAIGFSSLPSIAVQQRLIASRRPATSVALLTRHTHATVKRHSSALDRATELAVSRGLLSAR